jgi:hypothetical protein
MNAYHKYSITVLLAFHVIGSLAHAGKLYTWMDENGQTQYSDRPPVGSNYTEKHIRSGSRGSNTAGPGGLRHGELGLLRKNDSREAGITASRRAASKQYEKRKHSCTAAKKRYSDALRSPRSRGLEYKERAKNYYHKMRDVCF